MKPELSDSAKKAEEFLLQIEKHEQLISQLEDAYQKACEIATSSTQHLSDMRVQTSRRNGSEHKMLDVSAAADMIEAEKKKHQLAFYNVVRVINMVNNPVYKTYLYARYVNGKTREETAEALSISLKWLDIRIRPRSLEAVASVIKKRSH